MTPIVIPFFSGLAAKEWVGSTVQRLEAPGGRVQTADAFRQEVLKGDRSLRAGHTFLFVGTGGTETAIADFLSDVRLQPPILLLSHDGNNSLPAAMETRTHLESVILTLLGLWTQHVPILTSGPGEPQAQQKRTG